MARNISRPGIVLTAVLTATIIGCGGGSAAIAGALKPTGADAPGADGTAAAITIKGFRFGPSPLQVKVGQKITVTNVDSAVHTIKADDKSFNSKDLAKGKSYTFTVTKPGKHTYVCDIHQYMTGEIDAS